MEKWGKATESVEKFHSRSVERLSGGRDRTDKKALFDPVKMEFVVERLAVDSEQFGGLRLVAAHR